MNIKLNSKTEQIVREAIRFRKVTMPPEIKASQSVTDSLSILSSRWPECDEPVRNDQQHPVFVLSAGWRSGSTLMQRLLISSEELIIWGEPLDDSAIIPRLSSGICAITNKWPDSSYFSNQEQLNALSNQWIANLTPPIQYLKQSHRHLFETWLAEPAMERYGVSRWGIKEVRLTIDHANYLKWLFPNAKFIFMFRNPFMAYRSWKGNLWGSVWPGYFSWSPIVFAKHWKHLVEGFLQGYKKVDGIIIRFEEFISKEFDLDRIRRFLGLKKIDPTIMNKKIDSFEQRKKKEKRKLNYIDKAIIKTICGKLLKKYGYVDN